MLLNKVTKNHYILLTPLEERKIVHVMNKFFPHFYLFYTLCFFRNQQTFFRIHWRKSNKNPCLVVLKKVTRIFQRMYILFEHKFHPKVNHIEGDLSERELEHIIRNTVVVYSKKTMKKLFVSISKHVSSMNLLPVMGELLLF